MLFACNLGADDHRLVTIDVAATQPDDIADGLFVDISANCGHVVHSCLLQVTALDATLQRAGDTVAMATFCQHQPTTEPVPVVLFPPINKTEVVVQARLLDGDATGCEGLLLAQSEVVVAAKLTPVVVDGGVVDAR
jgi:hypothetical protein